MLRTQNAALLILDRDTYLGVFSLCDMGRASTSKTSRIDRVNDMHLVAGSLAARNMSTFLAQH